MAHAGRLTDGDRQTGLTDGDKRRMLVNAIKLLLLRDARELNRDPQAALQALSALAANGELLTWAQVDYLSDALDRAVLGTYLDAKVRLALLDVSDGTQLTDGGRRSMREQRTALRRKLAGCRRSTRAVRP